MVLYNSAFRYFTKECNYYVCTRSTPSRLFYCFWISLFVDLSRKFITIGLYSTHITMSMMRVYSTCGTKNTRCSTCRFYTGSTRSRINTNKFGDFFIHLLDLLRAFALNIWSKKNVRVIHNASNRAAEKSFSLSNLFCFLADILKITIPGLHRSNYCRSPTSLQELFLGITIASINLGEITELPSRTSILGLRV